MTSYITAVTDYAASFSVAQLALKVTDAGLCLVEDVLKKTGTNEESTVVSEEAEEAVSEHAIKKLGVTGVGESSGKFENIGLMRPV